MRLRSNSRLPRSCRRRATSAFTAG